jgi:molybdate transport system regulatory protein
MELNYKIWLEHDHRVIFGRGRKELLRAIDECKSLKGAAEKLNMSYRAAWGRLKASEDRLGKKMVDVDPLRRGMQLTEDARALMKAYEKLERDIEHVLEKDRETFLSVLKK